MFRKDSSIFRNSLLAAALTLVGSLAPIMAARAQSSPPTPNGTRIDTAVSISYLPAADGPMLTTASNTASVTVDQVAGVVLSPSLGTKQVSRPLPTIFPVTVRNTGDGPDTFTLSLTRPVRWGAQLMNPVPNGASSAGVPAPLTITLKAGESHTFNVLVTPPSVSSGMVVLKAASAISNTTYAQAAVILACATPHLQPSVTRTASAAR